MTIQAVRRSLENFDKIMGKVSMHTGRIFGPEASTIIVAIQKKRQLHTKESHQEVVSPELESLLCRLVTVLPADIRAEVQKAAMMTAVH